MIRTGIQDIISIASTIKNTFKYCLSEAIFDTPAKGEDYDMDIDHNNHIIISEKKSFLNVNSETDEEYEDERWKAIIVIGLVHNEFVILKEWELPAFCKWNSGEEKDWKTEMLSEFNQSLKSLKHLFQNKNKEEEVLKAVLSTTVIPLDGVYKVETLQVAPNISGVPHYIGHPDTKSLVESLGAIQSKTKLFTGLNIGEVAVCFPIQQGKSNRANDGFTSPHQKVTLSDLSVRVIKRIK